LLLLVDCSGILLTQTRLSVDKLIDIIKEIPQLRNRVLPLKLVGQGRNDLTMTDVQQEYALKKFRLGEKPIVDKFLRIQCYLCTVVCSALRQLDM
jgi:ERCC4-related helicase